MWSLFSVRHKLTYSVSPKSTKHSLKPTSTLNYHFLPLTQLPGETKVDDLELVKRALIGVLCAVREERRRHEHDILHG